MTYACHAQHDLVMEDWLGPYESEEGRDTQMRVQKSWERIGHACLEASAQTGKQPWPQRVCYVQHRQEEVLVSVEHLCRWRVSGWQQPWGGSCGQYLLYILSVFACGPEQGFSLSHGPEVSARANHTHLLGASSALHTFTQGFRSSPHLLGLHQQTTLAGELRVNWKKEKKKKKPEPDVFVPSLSLLGSIWLCLP